MDRDGRNDKYVCNGLKLRHFLNHICGAVYFCDTYENTSYNLIVSRT